MGLYTVSGSTVPDVDISVQVHSTSNPGPSRWPNTASPMLFQVPIRLPARVSETRGRTELFFFRFYEPE
jgi:hypothetical protein